MGLFEAKVGELVSAGQEMAQEGHFDAENILAQCNAVQARSVTRRGSLLPEISWIHL